KCPVHEDGRASLTIGVGQDGTVLMKCFAGCSTADVVGCLGLSFHDLFPNNGNGNGNGQAHTKGKTLGTIIETYDYRDEADALMFQVCRFEPKDFRQRKLDGNGGWTWKLGDVRRVLYQLPKLLKADPAVPVYVCEGEKDVQFLERLGLVATTNAGGAGKW